MSGLTNFSSPEDAGVPEHAYIANDVANGTRLNESSDAVPQGATESAPEELTPEAATSPSSLSPESWRDEVAARLEQYRTRRKPRTPRYPSLLLPFDAPESWSRQIQRAGSSAVVPTSTREDPALRPVFDLASEDLGNPDLDSGRIDDPEITAQRAVQHPQSLETGIYRHSDPEQSARIIEFPRSAAIPVFRGSELADPIFDRQRPRIVEAPEILPPPPALGGMLIESVRPELPARRAGNDFPIASSLSSASIARRSLAALVDFAIVGAALAAFSVIFLRVNPSRLSLPLFGGGLATMAVVLWIAYEFLFVVYTGSTPGLRAARLQLARFDGSPLNRRILRWRVMASFLSAFSAGLGYLWCVLDQDGLCWHDRITHTHVQMRSREEL